MSAGWSATNFKNFLLEKIFKIEQIQAL